MLVKDCSGCRFILSMIGIGRGVCCNHPDNKTEEGPIVITKVKDCTKFDPK